MALDTTTPMNLLGGLKGLYSHLTVRRRRQLAMVLGLMLVGAFAELVTLGAVLPFLALIADPGKAASYPILQHFFVVLGWTSPEQILTPVTALFAAVALGAAAVRLLLTWVSQRFVFRLGHDLGLEVYRRTLYQPYSYHVAKNTSELIAATNKVQSVISSIMLPLMQAVAGAVISLFILTALVVIDAGTAFMAALGFGAMYVAVTFATRRRLRENSKIIARAQSSRVQTVQEGLGGIRDVLIDQAQPVYLAKFARIDSEFRDAQALNGFIGSAPRFMIEAFGMVLIAVLALVLSRQPGGLMTALPVLGALALGAQRLLPLLQLIYNGWTEIAGSRHMLFDVLEILELPVEASPSEAVKPLPFCREISLNAVSFRYGAGQADVLKKVTLQIEKGARIGFIGQTGSGKSTTMDLVLGLLQPTGGEIRVDGQLLTPQTVKSWQAQIAHVPQAIYLADTTIAENIAFGVAPDVIDISRVIEAAGKARLHDFIKSLPNGYRTAVGERGVRLSGGQRQRIGIARALYKQASVLVFDEATSALDTETEAAVMEAIQALSHDLTILMIAHRLSTVKMCDNIFKLDAGRVVAEGPEAVVIGRDSVSPLPRGLNQHAL